LSRGNDTALVSTSSIPFRLFIGGSIFRLSATHMTWSWPRLFPRRSRPRSLDHRRSRLFEASACTTASRGPPSFLAQHSSV
jgi:hypothetical protein